MHEIIGHCFVLFVFYHCLSLLLFLLFFFYFSCRVICRIFRYYYVLCMHASTQYSHLYIFINSLILFLLLLLLLLFSDGQRLEVFTPCTLSVCVVVVVVVGGSYSIFFLFKHFFLRTACGSQHVCTRRVRGAGYTDACPPSSTHLLHTECQVACADRYFNNIILESRFIRSRRKLD